MKNDNRSISKNKLTKALKNLGLEMRRDFSRKLWVLSNGEEFASLNDIASKYKVQ
jgi:hypothetical protein